MTGIKNCVVRVNLCKSCLRAAAAQLQKGNQMTLLFDFIGLRDPFREPSCTFTNSRCCSAPIERTVVMPLVVLTGTIEGRSMKLKITNSGRKSLKCLIDFMNEASCPCGNQDCWGCEKDTEDGDWDPVDESDSTSTSESSCSDSSTKTD